MTESRLKRLDPYQLDELMENETLTDVQFQMVQAEVERREMEGYFNRSLFGEDNEDLSIETRWDLAEA